VNKFGIRQSKVERLRRRMKKYGVEEKDLKEKFVASSKKGGTKSDKSSSGVYIKHLPSGTEVKSSSNRSQGVNRFLARRTLVDKIEEKVKGKKSSRQRKIEKIRKRKRKRAQRARRKRENENKN